MQREPAASPRNRHAAGVHAGPATPTPPPATWHDLTPLQRDHAARLPGLRGPRGGQPQNDTARGRQAGATHLRATSPGRNAMQREPTALPSAPSAPDRPASHKPPAPAAIHLSRPLLASHQTETVGRNAMHRDHLTPLALARLTPTRVEALRATTLAEQQRPTPPAAQQPATNRPHPLAPFPRARPVGAPVPAMRATSARSAPSAVDLPCSGSNAPIPPTRDLPARHLPATPPPSRLSGRHRGPPFDLAGIEVPPRPGPIVMPIRRYALMGSEATPRPFRYSTQLPGCHQAAALTLPRHAPKEPQRPRFPRDCRGMIRSLA